MKLNGKRPSARDRWKAFYRLWRMTQQNDGRSDATAADCFYILGGVDDFVHLVTNNEYKHPSRNHLPKFLRRMILDSDRHRRLYGYHPEWLEGA